MTSAGLCLLAFALALGQASDASDAFEGRDCHATAFIGTSFRDSSGTTRSMRSEIGAFPDGYAFPTVGELIHAGNESGDLGCSVPWNRVSGRSWIALVRRGGCSVEMKIENALRERASGIIIYNNRDSLNLSKSKVARIYQGTISVVFTYKWKGDELISLLSSGTRIIVDLAVANPCVAVNSDHDRNMQLVSISFLCFIVLTISLAWLIFYYVQRYKDLQAKERKARGYSEADEKALKSIPTKTIKSNDKLLKDESECCAICIDPYRPTEIVRTLVCNHEFHKSCIDPWLLENRTCPMCKKDILRHYGSVFLGSQESILQVVADEATRLAGSSSSSQSDLESVVVGEVSRPPSPTASVDINDTHILTESAQPVNEDFDYIPATSAALVPVESPLEEVSFAGIRNVVIEEPLNRKSFSDEDELSDELPTGTPDEKHTVIKDTCS